MDEQNQFIQTPISDGKKPNKILTIVADTTILSVIAGVILIGFAILQFRNIQAEQPLVTETEAREVPITVSEGNAAGDQAILEENGFVFADGTQPTVSAEEFSSISFDPAQLSAEKQSEYERKQDLVNQELANNPIFDEFDSLYQILPFDQIDDEGRPSLEGLDLILQIAAEGNAS